MSSCTPSRSGRQMKYYGVQCGREPGVYFEWRLCELQGGGCAGSVYRWFRVFSEAVRFVLGNDRYSTDVSGDAHEYDWMVPPFLNCVVPSSIDREILSRWGKGRYVSPAGLDTGVHAFVMPDRIFVWRGSLTSRQLLYGEHPVGENAGEMCRALAVQSVDRGLSGSAPQASCGAGAAFEGVFKEARGVIAACATLLSSDSDSSSNPSPGRPLVKRMKREDTSTEQLRGVLVDQNHDSYVSGVAVASAPDGRKTVSVGSVHGLEGDSKIAVDISRTLGCSITDSNEGCETASEGHISECGNVPN